MMNNKVELIRSALTLDESFPGANAGPLKALSELASDFSRIKKQANDLALRLAVAEREVEQLKKQKQRAALNELTRQEWKRNLLVGTDE